MSKDKDHLIRLAALVGSVLVAWVASIAYKKGKRDLGD